MLDLMKLIGEMGKWVAIQLEMSILIEEKEQFFVRKVVKKVGDCVT